jgi:hypothetical protein
VRPPLQETGVDLVMDFINSKIIRFEPRPLVNGTGWYVMATYPDGQEQEITGFNSEVEAMDWIDSDRCVEWVKVRGYE